MLIHSATMICFSPTGTTKKILNAILEGLNLEIVQSINLNLSKVRNSTITDMEGDIVLVGVPVYEVGVPKLLIPFLNRLKGEQRPIVLVSVYGNMGEGIALNHLDILAHKSDFNAIAAGWRTFLFDG